MVVRTAWVTVLPAGAIRSSGTGVKASLLQDHERALWKERPITAMKRNNIQLLDHFPKCSQDLIPIEPVWRELRARLADTEPTHKESRDEFIVRMRNAVSWINRNRKEWLLHICSCQKEWAQDV